MAKLTGKKEAEEKARQIVDEILENGGSLEDEYAKYCNLSNEIEWNDAANRELVWFYEAVIGDLEIELVLAAMEKAGYYYDDCGPDGEFGAGAELPEGFVPGWRKR